MDRSYYRDHAVTIARHPTETDERVMVRLLAYALHADDGLAFGRGIGAEDEPALWKKDLTGRIEAAGSRSVCPDEKILPARPAGGRTMSWSMPMADGAPRNAGTNTRLCCSVSPTSR
ncbi:MAG: YaeQ family protein [Nitrospiraceae bacterium]